MNPLSIELFLQPFGDVESRQYRIMDALRVHYQQFKANKLYPHLAELIEFSNTLQSILHHLHQFRDGFPKYIRHIDIAEQKIVYEFTDPGALDLQSIEEMIKWAMPHIKKTIEEGIVIYDFVDERLKLESVGILPQYREEGYVMVPDKTQNQVHLFQFSLSVYASGTEPKRLLKTQFHKSIEWQHVYPSPHSVKLDLIKENAQLPNPAFFAFDTPLEIPFKETILPVAKRKLIHELSKLG